MCSPEMIYSADIIIVLRNMRHKMSFFLFLFPTVGSIQA